MRLLPALFLLACMAGLSASTVAQRAGVSPILFEQRQRELILVRHLRQHVADPGDGLALSADRRDLQRQRSGAPAPLTSLSPTASDDELVDASRLLADVWYARLVERTPFGRMHRERLQALAHLQRALGQLQSRAGGHPELAWWLPSAQEETSALLRAASGQGDVGDTAVEVALQIADAAASGRPMTGPGPYPVVGPPASPASGSSLPPYSPGYPGDRPLPPPATAGPTPYSLPPAYEAYGAAGAGVGGLAACQTLRTAAGVSLGVSDMLRAAECWMRTPTWPGWGAQSLEALDWAVGLAAAERNCTALQTALTALREAGPRLSAGGLTPSVAALAKAAESDDRRLRAQGLCR